MLGEIAVRLAIGLLLAWQALVAGDALVGVLCGLAASYHVYVCLKLGSLRATPATGLTIDAWGLTLRELWRDRRVSWSQIQAVTASEGRPLADRRPGVIVAIGDSKGQTDRIVLPDVFAIGRHALAAEIQSRRAA